MSTTNKFEESFQTILDEYNDLVQNNNELVEALEQQNHIVEKQDTALRIQETNIDKYRARVDSDAQEIRKLNSTVALLQKDNKLMNQTRAESKKLKAQVDRTKETNTELKRKATRLEGKVRELEKELHLAEKKNIELGRNLHKAKADSAWLIYQNGSDSVFINPTKVEVDGEEQRTLLYKHDGVGVLREVGLKGITMTIGTLHIDDPDLMDAVNAHMAQPSEQTLTFMEATLLDMKQNDWSYAIK